MIAWLMDKLPCKLQVNMLLLAWINFCLTPGWLIFVPHLWYNKPGGQRARAYSKSTLQKSPITYKVSFVSYEISCFCFFFLYRKVFKKICTIIVYMFSDWMRTCQVPLVKTKDLPGMYKIHSHLIRPSTFKLQEIFGQSDEGLRHNDWPHWKQ